VGDPPKKYRAPKKPGGGESNHIATREAAMAYWQLTRPGPLGAAILWLAELTKAELEFDRWLRATHVYFAKHFRARMRRFSLKPAPSPPPDPPAPLPPVLQQMAKVIRSTHEMRARPVLDLRENIRQLLEAPMLPIRHNRQGRLQAVLVDRLSQMKGQRLTATQYMVLAVLARIEEPTNRHKTRLNTWVARLGAHRKHETGSTKT
jgi:hypothetical protein